MGEGGGRIGRRGVLAGLGAGATLGTAAALMPRQVMADAGSPAVDVALLLAVDASASISKGLLDFQLRGHADAFRHQGVAAAIAGGPMGRIAVQLCQFAGPDTLTTLVPWTLLSNAEECADFARRIDAAPGIAMGGSTALGSAVIQGVERLDGIPFSSTRRTIDIVSNGFNNAGLDPLTARGHAAAAGVTVNALAILDEYDWLESYYAGSVIAGRGSFVRTAATREDFAAAFLAKLVTEIA
ncbi:DUF1194 domain-containing protein [Indioceanicola profundi]|uniref:DUF1194 domain-containing protein n=1 Tax=Indioceanicola profundi TaxID=2220096 RepID=UPI000E6AB335|nr:DUF1194 domain-containing protein [Indioceanicola profundi]